MSKSSSAVKPQIKYDGNLTIATGRSRKETSWKNQELLWSQLVEKLSRTIRTHETYEEYKKLSRKERDQIKDVGGFVGGTLKGGRRKTEAVVWRQVITLDADHIKGDFWASVEVMLGCGCAVYSTHKHSQTAPRLRLVLPLSRPVAPDEYQAVARRIAADLGIDFFDDTTYQAHRLMYWPSTAADGEYYFRYLDEPWLDPDEALARYPDWRDPSYWPESSRTRQERKKLADKQGDPLDKPGIVGAFCRAYAVSAALEMFLGEIYEPCGEGRYTYTPGTSVGGLVLYDQDKFAYSHHGTDPIGGRLVNAFDLVRLHKFGELDDDVEPGTPSIKLPSFIAMSRFAEDDPLVSEVKYKERMAAIEEDFKTGNVNPKRLFFEEKKFISAYMGEWFLKRHHAVVINNDLYIYVDGVYTRGERVFLEESTAALGVEFNTTRINEALAYIKNTVPNVPPEEATTNEKYLNVQNGLLDLASFELVPHTPEMLTVVQLPVVYDPEADSTAIDEFLRLVAPADCVPIIEEMAGYCLIPSMKYEKALMLVGEGGNGKGTLIAVLTSLLGAQNVANVSFQDLSENRFASAELFGKMANLHADIPNKILENSSRFKELVSGDMIRAEEKHKQPFSFHNRAKLIFSANEPPISKDNTEGFHRKLLIVPFPVKFTDRELRRRLFTPEALSGFLVRALQGLKRLQTQDGFSRSDNVIQALSDYRERGDTVFRFIEECCTLEPEAMTPKQDVYDAYRSMCLRWGNQPINQANFNARLQIVQPEISEYRRTSPRKWRGLKVENASDFLV